MTQIYTPNFVKNCQSNLHIKIGAESRYSHEITEPNKYDEYYFQILIFEDVEGVGKLVYGTKSDLQDTYNLDPSSFPTPGVIVDPKFVSATDQIETAVLSTVRFLLQSRKLSQIMTYTWLEPDRIPENKKHQIKLIRKILDSYNIIPDTYWVNDQNEVERIKAIEIEKKLLEIKETKDGLLNLLIKPEYISYCSIFLALLLSGQAYYQDEGNQWTRICEPIFSTYEIVWEYALDISWDTFYASRIDLSQAGQIPKPPYTKVTFGYPSRPDEFSLGQDRIEKWVTAQEKYSDDNEYPFYPQEETKEWQNQQLKFVVPPYPYIPLSTS